MNKTLMRILQARAEHFAEFVALLRDQLQERSVEPSDSSLIEVAGQLYAIGEDESEIYPDDDDDGEGEGDW